MGSGDAVLVFMSLSKVEGNHIRGHDVVPGVGGLGILLVDFALMLLWVTVTVLLVGILVS